VGRQEPARECLRVFNLGLPVAEWAKEEGIDDTHIRERIIEAADRKMAEKAANYGPKCCGWPKRACC